MGMCGEATGFSEVKGEEPLRHGLQFLQKLKRGLDTNGNVGIVRSEGCADGGLGKRRTGAHGDKAREEIDLLFREGKIEMETGDYRGEVACEIRSGKGGVGEGDRQLVDGF